MLPIFNHIQLLKPSQISHFIQLNRLFVWYYLILIPSHKEGWNLNVTNEFVAVPSDSQDQWLDQSKEGKELVSHC